MSTATDEARAKAARDAVYAEHKPVLGWCAQYTANMAYYFMKGEMKSEWGNNGNMGTQEFYNKIQNMGYNLSINQTNLSKYTLKTSIHNSTFPPGSVVCYKGEEGNPEKSYYRYGHAQFYVGGDRNRGSSFPSSKVYNSAFVYDGEPCNKWAYKVFTPSGSSALYYCEQEYVPISSTPTLASPPANNNGKPGSGADFYKPYNVSISESDRDANAIYVVNRLRNEAGLSLNEACAMAGCFGRESHWNPTSYSNNQQYHDFGLAQWTVGDGRQQYLFEKICNSDKTKFRDIVYQTDFAIFELKNKYTSPSNGRDFHYNVVPCVLHKQSQKGAGLLELTWYAVCYYEAGSDWRNIPYDQLYWDKDTNHIRERFTWAQRARKLFSST
jgi:hypothetical protein